jgi:hypothetical protein
VSVGQYSSPKNVGLLEQGCGLLAYTLYPVSYSEGFTLPRCVHTAQDSCLDWTSLLQKVNGSKFFLKGKWVKVTTVYGHDRIYFFFAQLLQFFSK